MFFTKFMEVKREWIFIRCRAGLLFGGCKNLTRVSKDFPNSNKITFAERVMRREGSNSKGK